MSETDAVMAQAEHEEYLGITMLQQSGALVSTGKPELQGYQFVQKKVEELSLALQNEAGYTSVGAQMWLNREHHELNATPLEAFCDGRFDKVIALACDLSSADEVA